MVVNLEAPIEIQARYDRRILGHRRGADGGHRRGDGSCFVHHGIEHAHHRGRGQGIGHNELSRCWVPQPGQQPHRSVGRDTGHHQGHTHRVQTCMERCVRKYQVGKRQHDAAKDGHGPRQPSNLRQHRRRWHRSGVLVHRDLSQRYPRERR